MTPPTYLWLVNEDHSTTLWSEHFYRAGTLVSEAFGHLTHFIYGFYMIHDSGNGCKVGTDREYYMESESNSLKKMSI